MQGGHNRLPDEVKKARGSFNGSRENPDRPQVAPVEIPAAPEAFDALQKQTWDRLRLAVDELRCAGAPDLEGFTLLVLAVARVHRLMKSKTTPATQISAALKEARQWMNEFGLTPSSRSRVTARPAQPAADDPFEEFCLPQTPMREVRQ
jgi:phage terminase small subunit